MVLCGVWNITGFRTIPRDTLCLARLLVRATFLLETLTLLLEGLNSYNLASAGVGAQNRRRAVKKGIASLILLLPLISINSLQLPPPSAGGNTTGPLRTTHPDTLLKAPSRVKPKSDNKVLIPAKVPV